MGAKVDMGEIGGFEEPWKLASKLRELGVSGSVWEVWPNDLPETEALPQSLDILKHYLTSVSSPNAIESLSTEVSEAVKAEAWDKLGVLFMQMQTRASSPDAIESLGREEQTKFSLWGAQESLDSGAPEVAMALYRAAVELVPRVSGLVEVGRVLLKQAGVETLPYDPWDLDEGEGMELFVNDDVFQASIVPPPLRREVLNLAREAYGRAYGHYLWWTGVDSEYAVIDQWRQLLVLDGLRVVFLALDDFESADLTCRVFSRWTEVMGDEFSEYSKDALLIKSGFSDTEGFVRGRRVEEVIQQAVEEARRKVVVSDPGAFARQVAETVAAQLGPPLATRAQIERQLDDMMGEAWRDLADSIRQFLIDGEWLRDYLESADAHDFGSVVVYYAKAVEGYLRQMTNSTDILSAFRRSFRDRQPFLTALFDPSSIDILSSKTIIVANARDDAAHGDPRSYRPITRSRMADIRSEVLGSNGRVGLLTLLHRHRKK